jgi:hypothetical protein
MGGTLTNLIPLMILGGPFGQEGDVKAAALPWGGVAPIGATE